MSLAQGILELTFDYFHAVGGPAVAKDGPTGDVQVARAGQVAAVIFGGPLIALGLCRYLGRRPALQELPEGQSLWSAGFFRVGKTAGVLRTNFRTLGFFYLGYAFWEAATGAVTTLTGTYVLEELGMSGAGFGTVALLVVLCVPGP